MGPRWTCVVAELTRQAHRQGLAVEDLLPRALWLVTAVLTKVLDLTDPETQQALGVEADELVRDDLQLTHEIGEASDASEQTGATEGGRSRHRFD